jgi:hypothetical protein
VLPGFQQRYPQVQLELDFNDRIVDVVSEGLDAVIRSGELADSSLTARRLGGFRFMLCAAPGYLQAHGTPGMWASCACIPRCASVTPPPESCIRGSCRASKAMPERACPGRFSQGRRGGTCGASVTGEEGSTAGPEMVEQPHGGSPWGTGTIDIRPGARRRERKTTTG